MNDPDGSRKGSKKKGGDLTWNRNKISQKKNAMEATGNTTQKQSVLKRLAEKLMEAQRELDELALQLALGKAEAKDRFEDIKKEFGSRVRDWRSTLTGSMPEALSVEIRQRIDELEKRLNGGEVEKEKEFNEQKSGILETLDRLQSIIKSSLANNIEASHFWHDIEKFKLKMEILRLKFALKTFIIKDDFHEGLRQAHERIDSLLANAQHKVKEGKAKFADFRDEAEEAYQHLRDALKKL